MFIPLVRRLHFYAGVLVAPFLVVAAVTGLLYALTPQFDRVAYGDQLRVARVGDAPRPLAEQVRAARTAVPDGTLTAAIPPTTVDGTTRVVFAVPELGEKERTVYVDPYTNQVRGTLTTWFDQTPLATWLDDLHRNLHLGAFGRHYSELAASWLWVVGLGGLTLWLYRRRRPGWQRVRRTLKWHTAAGVWLLAGLLVLSATGLTWSRYAGARFQAVLDTLDAHGPELNTVLPSATSTKASSGGHHGTAAVTGGGTVTEVGYTDHVVRLARQEGLTGPVKVGFPADATSAWSVSQIDDTWPVRYDEVAVDPVSSTVTAENRWADRPLLSKLSTLGVQAHMGRLFGVVNQLLLAALALGLLFVILWGYRMWWQRRPPLADGRRLVGRPPARGAWRRLRVPVLVAGVLVVAAVGWAIPLLGLSLLGFLVIDAAVGIVARRTAKASP